MEERDRLGQGAYGNLWGALGLYMLFGSKVLYPSPIFLEFLRFIEQDLAGKGTAMIFSMGFPFLASSASRHLVIMGFPLGHSTVGFCKGVGKGMCPRCTPTPQLVFLIPALVDAYGSEGSAGPVTINYMIRLQRKQQQF
jgi:hypothetical protein